jgi:hypothetical protein
MDPLDHDDEQNEKHGQHEECPQRDDAASADFA